MTTGLSLLRDRRVALLAILGFALVVRVINLWIFSQLPIAEYQFHWPQSDMTASYEWSGQILHGDVLGRDPYHPYHDWMAKIASHETWKRWWGGKAVFHQAPLYAYFLAAMRWLAGDGFWGIGLCQALLGIVNVGLIFLLGERFFSLTTAYIAAAGAAIYGPLLLHEPLLLRDGLGVTTSLLLLWGLARCDEARWRRWFVAGILFAVAVLARETALLFAPLVLLWICQRFWKQKKSLRVVSLSFVAGAALGLLPLAARNVAVGVKPWLLSNRSIEAFIYGNAADGMPLGFYLPGSAPAILQQADGHLGTAVRLTLATYGGDWWRLIRQESLKARYLLSSYEAMDNVDWYYFAARSPLLRFSPQFDLVLALGLVGIWISRRDAARHWLLWYFLAATFAGLMYATIVGRYRLAAAAGLLLYAGYAVQWIIHAIRQRRWQPLGWASVTIAAAIVLSHGLLGGRDQRFRYRPTEYALAANTYLKRNQPERAMAELREALRQCSREANQIMFDNSRIRFAQSMSHVAHQIGRDAEAVAAIEKLAQDYPQDAPLQQLLRSLSPSTIP